MDSLSEEDVMLLHQAIAYRRASRLAKAVYSIGNVMSCIKTLMLEHSEQQHLLANAITSPSPDVKLEVDATVSPDGQATTGANSCFENDNAMAESDEIVENNEMVSSKDKQTTPDTNPTNSTKSNSTQANRKNSGKRKTLPKQAVSSTEAMFTCEKCGYQTKRKDHFKRHCASHAEVKPIRCSLCPFSCIDNYHLVRHLNSSVHNNKRKHEELKCESCDYTTNYANRMLRHVRTHSGEKPFACNYCSYKAAQKATLDRHILTHTGEKPFKCEKCEYCAADTKSLRFHTLQKHAADEETVHKCPQCEYSTPVSRYFKLHMRAHSDARPYLCDICGYSAKRPHGLTKHYRAVHGWSKSDTDGKQWRRCPADVPSMSSDVDSQSQEESNAEMNEKEDNADTEYQMATTDLTSSTQNLVTVPQQVQNNLMVKSDTHCNGFVIPSNSFVLPAAVTASAEACEAAFLSCHEREADSAADTYLGAVLSEMSASVMSADSGGQMRTEGFF